MKEYSFMTVTTLLVGKSYSKVVNKLCLILGFVIVLFLGCSQQSTQKNGIKISDSTLILTKSVEKLSNLPDSTFFLESKSELSNTYTLNDSNTFSIKNISIRLESRKNDTYHLLINNGEQVLFSRDNLQGISKIFFKNNTMLFMVYDFYDEDGNNEGKILHLDLNTNKVNLSPLIFKNTCNPVIIDNNFYALNDYSLKILDSGFKLIKEYRIIYNFDSDSEYLDTGLFCSLDTDSKNLFLKFTPRKSNIVCKNYLGQLDLRNSSSLILLKPD